MDRSPQRAARWEEAPTEELSPGSLPWAGRCAVPRPSAEELRCSAMAAREDLDDAPTEEISAQVMRAVTFDRGWFDDEAQRREHREAPIRCVQYTPAGRLLRAGLLFLAIWLPPALLVALS